VLHATVEATDACSALRLARTIFFSQGSSGGSSWRLGMPPTGPTADDAPVAVDGCPSSSSSCGAAAAAGGPAAEQGDQGLLTQPGRAADNDTAAAAAAATHVTPLLPPDQLDLHDLMAYYSASVDAAWRCMQHLALQVRSLWVT
jgi:hypothetical protein